MASGEEGKQPDWKNRIGWTAAILMAVLWLVAGVWKLTNLSKFQLMMTQMLVPVFWSMPAALALAVSEVFAGVLLLRPVWRRLGGYLSVGLLTVFMAYFAYNYETLKGEDCSCFPWLERTVGPAFFWSDAAMVAVAALAAWFAPRPGRFRAAGLTLVAICVAGGVMLAVDQLAPAADANVPAAISIGESELSLHEGSAFIFFFNPTCLHCLDAGTTMAELEWQAQFVGVPTQDYDWGTGFIDDTGLQNVKLSPDLDPLKQAFPFEDVPYAVAVENGRVLERFRFFEEPELSQKLREIGFVK